MDVQLQHQEKQLKVGDGCELLTANRDERIQGDLYKPTWSVTNTAGSAIEWLQVAAWDYGMTHQNGTPEKSEDHPVVGLGFEPVVQNAVAMIEPILQEAACMHRRSRQISCC